MPFHRRFATAFVAAFCVASTVAAFSAPQQKPPPRSARFVEIQNEDGFRGFFNVAQGTVRFVATLSPTCDECRHAFAEIRRIMEETPTKRLRAYIVYQPVEEADTRTLAFSLASELNEPRAAHFWDPNFSVSTLLAPIVPTGDTTRSRCYVFPTNAMLTDSPGDPAVVMFPHGHDGAFAFNGDVLEATVQELLERFEAQHRRRAPEGSEAR